MLGIEKTKYSTYSLINTSEPAELPITLDQAKLWLNEDENEAYYDNVINDLIATATKYSENYISSAIITRGRKLTFDNYCYEQVINLPDIQISDVSEVAYYDAYNVKYIIDPTNYFLDRSSSLANGRIIFNDDFSIEETIRPYSGVEITYSAGWLNAAAVPEDLKNAISAIVAYWYYDREATQGKLPVNAQEQLNAYKRVKL